MKGCCLGQILPPLAAGSLSLEDFARVIVEKPKTTLLWILASIVSVLVTVYLTRGILSVLTQTYSATARFSGPFVLHGTAAIFVGCAHICMAGLYLSVGAYLFNVSKKIYITVGFVSLVGALGSYIASFLVR